MNKKDQQSVEANINDQDRELDVAAEELDEVSGGTGEGDTSARRKAKGAIVLPEI